MLDELKRQMRYEPDTGKLFWLISKKGVTKGAQVSPKPTTDGCMQCVFEGTHYYQHVLIWFYVTGEWPDPCVDHRNGVRSDNRWDNLRQATGSQNQYNRPGRSSTGRKNVFQIANGNFVVYFRVGDGMKSFGTYKTLDEATAAAKAIRIALHGDFANHSNVT